MLMPPGTPLPPASPATPAPPPAQATPPLDGGAGGGAGGEAGGGGDESAMKALQASRAVAQYQLSMDTYTEFIRILLGVLNTCLDPDLVPHNLELVYILLRRKDVLTDLHKDPVRIRQTGYTSRFIIGFF